MNIQSGSGFDLQKLLDNPQVRYALAGALAGGGMSLLKSFSQNRPARSMTGRALGAGALGAATGLGIHGVGTAAGYKMPQLKRAADLPFLRSLLLTRGKDKG